MASFCLTACTDDEGKQSSGTNLTPDEHKEKLENIGLEVLGKINPADHERLLNAIDNFARLVPMAFPAVERMGRKDYKHWITS